jgi:hypothetical protein
MFSKIRKRFKKFWKERKMTANRDLYTTEQLMARLKVFIGSCLTLTLMGIIFTILWSVIFVQQPLKAISPIDAKFFEVIIPVASFLCGILSGIMLNGSNQGALDAMQKTMQGFKEQAKASEVPVVKQRVEPRLDPVNTASPVAQGYGGKPAPIEPPHPEIE